MARPVNNARRFWLAYLALSALFGAAVGTFIVLERRAGPESMPRWSEWRPTGDNSQARQRQIATHVESQYHLTNGRKLVDVLPRGPLAGASEIREVGIATTQNPSLVTDFAYAPAESTAMYVLCGKAAKCAIDEGTSSVGRAALLKREALELALYTFTYVDVADAVAAFYPPPKGKNPAFVFFFQRSDLSEELRRPLRATLPQAKVAVRGNLTRAELNTVDELTARNAFVFSLGVDPAGQGVLYLAPFTG